MKFARLPLVAALVVGGGVVGALPAHAAETQWFNTTGDGGGFAAASVTVAFPSKTTADLKGWVRDVCPGDSKGAYVYVSYYMGGSDGGSYPKLLAKDTNGCGRATIPFDPAPVKKGNPRSPLRSVTITVCERDSDGGGSWCEDHTYKNWRV